ncbi:hypothetical protein J4465_01595 [Candidatus Pacearchaeota archaeon]|nr:hypothetical protein [Candidatus Pacearchaeota archaeon]
MKKYCKFGLIDHGYGGRDYKGKDRAALIGKIYSILKQDGYFDKDWKEEYKPIISFKFSQTGLEFIRDEGGFIFNQFFRMNEFIRYISCAGFGKNPHSCDNCPYLIGKKTLERRTE